MGQWVKHVAVRLWTALLTGGLAAMLVLPMIVGALGPGWMVIPGVCLLGAAYWLTGMAFGAMGSRRLERLLGEAAVWERAGMTREALQVLARAETTVDSFFFSPLSKKAPAGRLLAQMARLQLARTHPDASSEAIIGAYLLDFPQDREVALKWLDGLLSGKTVTQAAHDIAAAIGAAHPEDATLQTMLAQLYLSERRCDFAALQTYGQVVASTVRVSDDLLNQIADLFLAGRRMDRLALQVYLDVYERGNRDQRLLGGIAAGILSIHTGSLGASLLQRAGRVLAGLDPPRRRRLAEAFLPEISDESADRTPQRRRITWPDRISALQQMAVQAGRSALRIRVALSRLWQNVRWIGSTQQAKSALKWSALTAFVTVVGWLGVTTVMDLGTDIKGAQPIAEPTAPPITDPFTLQVAAYLKEADARRYVDQLKANGLDAYWTRASGTNKTWYQVRVSHFATKEAARAVGEELKGRQIIGDYYVANYKRPEVP